MEVRSCAPKSPRFASPQMRDEAIHLGRPRGDETNGRKRPLARRRCVDTFRVHALLEIRITTSIANKVLDFLRNMDRVGGAIP